MRITPLDVRKQEFRKAVRGFDCDEVRAFLSTLADEYETVLVDNKQIRELIMEQEDKIQEYQGMERNLRDTLMTAERVMKETRDNASKKGELIVKDAEMQAQRILEECRLRTEELRREIVVLRKEKESYLVRFKNLAQAQIQFVETHESDFEDLDNRLTNIVDSVVSTAGRTRRSTDKPHDITPEATPKATPVATLDPFAVENRIEGDPSAPRDLPSNEGGDPVDSEDKLEVAAPAAPMETDVWRDYDPGTDNKGDDETNGSIADLVSESLSESEEETSLADGPVMTKDEEPVAVGPDKDSI
ncbi:MAG: DivIVA domain-containing protein [Candidatus Krumholzibacteria bacterium]|nr:DivIVA domain-containing protein [Candidatus Krumholzibacteria bacterium]